MMVMIILSLLLLFVALCSAVFGLLHNDGIAVWYAEVFFVVSLAFFLLAQRSIHKRKDGRVEKEDTGPKH